MKIRNGFVSNSSSSSFCIYGTYMELDEFVEKIITTDFLTEDELKEFEKMIKTRRFYNIESIISKKTNFEFYESEGNIWIGRKWSSIDDNETGLQFKENVKSELEKMTGFEIKCETHEEEICN